MKLLTIDKQHANAIMEAFEKKQGKATARIVYSISEVERIVKSIDDRLGNITKKAKEGTTAYIDYAQTFPRAYKYNADSTQYRIIFKSGVWKIDVDSIRRWTCPKKEHKADGRIYDYSLELSESAQQAILERYI